MDQHHHSITALQNDMKNILSGEEIIDLLSSELFKTQNEIENANSTTNYQSSSSSYQQSIKPSNDLATTTQQQQIEHLKHAKDELKSLKDHNSQPISSSSNSSTVQTQSKKLSNINSKSSDCFNPPSDQNLSANESNVSTDEHMADISSEESSNESKEIMMKGNSSLKLCQVCGQKAGRYNYYGGESCNSCRAFFRRSMENQRFSKFICRKEKKCTIDSRSWKSCQACRFQKCLASGMRIRSFSLKSPEQPTTSIAPTGSALSLPTTENYFPLVRNVKEVFTLEDEIYITGMREAFKNKHYDLWVRELSHNFDVFENIFQGFLKGKQFEMIYFKRYHTLNMASSLQFFKELQEFSNINNADKMKLIAKNTPVLLTFLQLQFLDTTNWWSMVNIFTDKIMRSSQKENIQQLDDKMFENLKLIVESHKQTNNYNHYNYNQLYPITWTNNAEIRHRHRDLTEKLREWTRLDKNSPTMDEILSFLMGMIIMFTTDFIDLKKAHVVEKHQMKYVNLLYKYIKYKLGDNDSSPLNRFCHGMQLNGVTREIHELDLKYRKY